MLASLGGFAAVLSLRENLPCLPFRNIGSKWMVREGRLAGVSNYSRQQSLQTDRRGNVIGRLCGGSLKTI